MIEILKNGVHVGNIMCTSYKWSWYDSLSLDNEGRYIFYQDENSILYLEGYMTGTGMNIDAQINV